MGRRSRRADQERQAQLRRAREQLLLLDALAAAMERRHEVFDVVEGAADHDDAVAGLQRLLGLSHEVQALAILDLQLRRLTAMNRAHIAEERDRLRSEVAADLGDLDDLRDRC